MSHEVAQADQADQTEPAPMTSEEAADLVRGEPALGGRPETHEDDNSGIDDDV
jgi:hypothetical protein